MFNFKVHDTQRLPLWTASIPGNETSVGNKTNTKIVLQTVTPSSTMRPTPPLVLLDRIKNLEIALSRISKTDLVAVEKLVNETLERTNISRPLHPHTVRDVWQMVEGRYEIHAFSAYYDDRPTLDEPLIRIVTIVNPDVEKIPVFCLHWYDHQDRPSLSVTFRVDIGAGWYQNNRGFKETIYSCKLPPGMGVPGNVSLIVVPHVIPSTLLRVNIPVKPKSSAEVIEFGHCPPIRFWIHDVFRLVELLELERLLGIKEVNIYGTEIDNATMSVINRYVREGFVVYTDMPSIIPANKKQDAIMFGSSPAINDCLLKNMYRYKYVVNTDLDEVIVPRGNLRNYSEMLSAIETSRGKNKEPALSYIFRNTYFFLDLGAVSDEPKYLAMERFQRRLEPSGPGYSVKSITRSSNCAGLHNHYCWGKIWNKASVFDVDVDFIYGANQHYKKCHFGATECDKILKSWVLDRTMKKFQKPLDDAVKNKLKTFSLV